MILCKFSEHGLFMSALQHFMKMILGSYILLVFINRICKQCYDRVVLQNVGQLYIPEHAYHISALTQANMKQDCSSVIHKHNLLILSRLSDFAKCRGMILFCSMSSVYISFETCYEVLRVSSYFLLALITTIYQCCYARMILCINFQSVVSCSCIQCILFKELISLDI